MERIRDVDISIPAMLIDKSEVLPDEEIERLLQESYQRAKNLIIKNKKKLLKLADVGEKEELLSIGC